jgi:Regulator of chromosome condensation (RCC1) repeat
MVRSAMHGSLPRRSVLSLASPVGCLAMAGGAAGSAQAQATGFSAVAAGGHHACAIKSADGSIVCSGDNGNGELNAPSGSFNLGRY